MGTRNNSNFVATKNSSKYSITPDTIGLNAKHQGIMLNEKTLFADRYELERLLGRGGFSEVWLARDIKTNVEVALKVYAPGQGIDDAGITLFKQEFSLVFSLNHTNLLHPSFFDSWQQMPYLILPYCRNGSVSAFLSSDAQITEEQCWQLLHDVASGLAYLHDQKPAVIHQDIKPDNILISDLGDYMITDFGISSRVRSTMNASGHMEASSGTLPYMGPERFTDDPRPILASDIWSVGATLFELMTKMPPFGNHGGLLQKGGADIPAIHESYSDDLKSIVYQCLAKNPWERPSARALVQCADERKAQKPITKAVTEQYDIFISYRRVDGAQYARILQLGLEKRGFRVFLDYDELNDGVFGENIKEAITAAPIFMPILSPQYLDRCKNIGDWVREEIMLAIRQQKRIVPVDPEKTFRGFPSDVPPEIEKAISSHLYSDIFFGQLMNASIDEMVKKRIQPYVSPTVPFSADSSDASSSSSAPDSTPKPSIPTSPLPPSCSDVAEQSPVNTPASKGKWIVGALAIILAALAFGAYLLFNKATDTVPSFSKSYSKELVQAAESGNPLAQYYLGLAYENSYGITADTHKAVEWYARAANQGLDSAQVSLGMCLFEGTGVTKDTDKALEWLHRAAEQGNVHAMYSLAQAYNALNQEEKAIQWLQRAADNGYTKAREALIDNSEE